MMLLRGVNRMACWTLPLRLPRAYFATSPPQEPKGEQDKAASSEPPAKPHPQQAQFSEAERELVRNYKVDQIYNIIHGYDSNYNFQRELIVHRKEFQKSRADLRSAILFQDLLKTQLNIVIYDTMGKPFRWQFIKFLYMMLSVSATFWIFDLMVEADPRNKVILEKTFYGKLLRGVTYFLATTLFFTALSRHLKFRRRFVEKLIYNTEKEQFIVVRRSFLGGKFQYPVSRYHILYTENPALNSQGINYFTIHDKDPLMLTYKDAWVKQDLFSHLISQRIKI